MPRKPTTPRETCVQAYQRGYKDGAYHATKDTDVKLAARDAEIEHAQAQFKLFDLMRLRFQVAHEFSVTLRTIIDP